MEIRTPAATQGRALWALLLATLGTTASQPLGGDSVCTARPLAKYSITFTGKWSQTAFPKQYPLFRPPAQWSSLLGEHSPAPARGLSTKGEWHLAAAPHLTVQGHSNPIHLSASYVCWTPTACWPVMAWALGVGGRMAESGAGH